MKWSLLLCAVVAFLVYSVVRRGSSGPPIYDFPSGGSIEWTVPHSHVLAFGRFRFRPHSSTQNFSVTTDSGQTLLTTPPNQPFLSASQTQVLEQESRGSFDFQFFNRGRACVDQTIQMVDVQGETLSLTGSWLCDDNERVPFVLQFNAHPEHVEIEVQTQDDLTHVQFSVQSSPDEMIFGGGAQFSHLDLKNHLVPIWSSEQGIGRGHQPLTFLMNLVSRAGGHEFSTYASSGQFLSNHNRAWILHNLEFSALDVRREDQLRLHVMGSQMQMSWLTGESPRQMLEKTSLITGRMRALPDWAHRGAIVGAQGGSKIVKEKVEALLSAGAILSGLWIQDWVGQRSTAIGKQLWWNWQMDSEHYANWNEFRSWSQSRSLNLLGYWNPMMVDHSQVPQTPSYFQQALDQQFLVKDMTGKALMSPITSFSAGWIDLSNPNARRWLQNIFEKEFLALGFKGWMADFSEGLPSDVQLSEGSESTLHHRYIEEWLRLNRKILEQQPTSHDLLFFNRAGVTNSPRTSTLFWLGDQMTTWDEHDGLASTLTALLSSGLSGMSLNHSDIGGYTAVNAPGVRAMRSEELLIRWMELNAFTAVFRSHEGNLPEENLQIYSTEKLRQAFAENSQMFHRLFEYRKQLLSEAEEKGWPLVRPMWFEYPDWSKAWTITRQFMLGSDILVAPVLEPGIESLEVVLPPGKWIHLITHEEWDLPQPQTIRISAPLGTPAAFLRANSSWKGRILGPLSP